MQPSIVNAPELLSTPSYWTSMTIIARDQWHWKYRSGFSHQMWMLPMAYTHWGPGENSKSSSLESFFPKKGWWSQIIVHNIFGKRNFFPFFSFLDGKVLFEMKN
jgi:hypothetical protein